MRANRTLVRGHEIPSLSNVLHTVKEWAREHVTQEKIAEAALVAGTSALLGYVLLLLHVAIQNRTLVGF